VGIELAGDNNQAGQNRIAHSDQAAVLIQGNDNRVQGNTIMEAGVGILKPSGSTGNVFKGNSFFATPIPVQDPAPQTNVHVSPARWELRRRTTREAGSSDQALFFVPDKISSPKNVGTPSGNARSSANTVAL
jgi:hypothetical protein